MLLLEEIYIQRGKFLHVDLVQIDFPAQAQIDFPTQRPLATYFILTENVGNY